MLKPMITTFAITSLNLLLPVTADAAEPLPAYKAADTFVFSNRRVEKIIKVKGDTLILANRSGREYRRHRNFTIPVLAWESSAHEESTKVSGATNSLWPLAVGKQSRFRTIRQRNNDTGSIHSRSIDLWSCDVKSKGKLSVTAGTFDAYRIECDRFSENNMRLQKRQVWHYSPDVGHYIKREEINYFNGKHNSYELLAALKGRNASWQRIEALLEQAN